MLTKPDITNWGIFSNKEGLEISASFSDHEPEIASGRTILDAIVVLFRKIHEIDDFAVTSSFLIEGDNKVTAIISAGNKDYEADGDSDVAALLSAIGEAAYYTANNRG